MNAIIKWSLNMILNLTSLPKVKPQNLFFYFFILVLNLNINAAQEDSAISDAEKDPCITQKLIWAGPSEPIEYVKPSDHKNIFIFRDDGTVFDKINKLEWKACPEGQQFINNRCLGSVFLYNWYEAPKEIARQIYAGKNDWRIPTIDELETVVDFCSEFGSYFNKAAFPETEAGIFWTSSDDPGFYNEYVAWYIDFSTAVSSFLDKERVGRLRLVRDR